MNQGGYLEVLKDELINMIKLYNMNPEKTIFQHYNDSCHTSNLINKKLEDETFFD